MLSCIPQRADDGLRDANLALERRDISLGGFFGDEYCRLACAIGDGAEQQVHADRGDMEALERDDARGQSLFVPAGAEHRGAACLAIVEQDAGIAAAGLPVGAKQRLQAHAQVGHARVGVAHRPRGTYRRAAAAARAQVRLDLDVIAVGANCAARAHVDALVAALLSRAAMGTNAG